jgi:hypothetical protein
MSQKTNDGKKGGLLKGDTHEDGGIKAIVVDTGQPVELETDEIIINAKSAKKHRKILSEINQDGGGVAIPAANEYKGGGQVVAFNRNDKPHTFAMKYARRIKKEMPEIWNKYGTSFENNLFEVLNKVFDRGYWKASEKDNYQVWKMYCFNHKHKDTADHIVGMFKCGAVTDKGYPHMKKKISQLNIGTAVEKKEHSETIKKIAKGKSSVTEGAQMIAGDHVDKESNEYYDHLADMEKGFKKRGGKADDSPKKDKFAVLRTEANRYSEHHYNEGVNQEIFFVHGWKQSDDSTDFDYIETETLSGKSFKVTPEQLFEPFKTGGEVGYEEITVEDEKDAPTEPVKVDQSLIGNESQLAMFDIVEEQELTKENVRDHLRSKTDSNTEPQLTMLSFGGGQDSFAILYKFIHDPAFRKRYAPNDFMVCMSDTGNEHPYTYKAIKEAQELCKKHNIHFKFLTSDMGYHTPEWQNLKQNMIKNSLILAAWGNKVCTSNLKINPVDKYMYAYMCKLYGFPETYGKRSWALYKSMFGTKVRVIIGFAENEEMRVVNSLKYFKNLPVWKQKNVEYSFPLIEEGISRQGAQDIITKYHAYLVPPSNCMICFYQSPHELVWLERHHPEEFYQWVDMEKAKIEKYRAQGLPDKDNKGVYSKTLLPEKLEKSKETYDPEYLPEIKIGDYSDEQLMEYKMSHGHCVKSNF